MHYQPLRRPRTGIPLESWQYPELQTLRTRSCGEEGRPQGGMLGRTICFTGRSRNHGSEPRPEVPLECEAALPGVRCVSSTKGGWRGWRCLASSAGPAGWVARVGLLGVTMRPLRPDTQPRGRPTEPKAGTELLNPVSRPRAGLNAQRPGGGLKAKVASSLP